MYVCMYVCTGVGDLYTDPQMHTVDQRDYGEANLGTKGMALFFSSHICNPICLAMGTWRVGGGNLELLVALVESHWVRIMLVVSV